MAESRVSWLVSDIQDMMSIQVPDRCLEVWCNVHGPQQHAEVCSIVVFNTEMYGPVSLLCIFDNNRVNYQEWI